MNSVSPVCSCRSGVETKN